MSDILTMNKDLVDANGRPIVVPKLEDVDAEDIPIEERGLQLPDPKGYKILCAIPDAAETYQGGIVKADSTRTIEEHSTVVLFVVKVGDLAYKDESRFPTGPWCKEGDFVLTRAYAGTRFKIHGREFRIINDDTVEGVVQDPRGYTRAQEKYMAEVKDGDIIFEYPDDLGNTESQNTTDNNSAEIKVKQKDNEVKIEAKTDDFDLEIEDDTPAEDRNKEPLPKEVVEEIEKDTLDDYSDRVKTRLSQMKKGWHDERRAKESAEREKEEAIRYAQQILEENKKLKTTLSSGEEEYLKALKSSLENQLDIAKRDYREAYNAGETDRIIEAQAKMNDAQLKLSQTENYERRFNKPLQNDEKDVYISQNGPSVPKPDSKALAWQEKNDWFGKDEEMTSLALGLHEKLVRSGVNPTSDEYYRRIDSTMQKRFPEYFGDATLDEEKPAERTKPSNVVAPATRSTAPKKVTISKSAAALARKLGITPEQYAKETLKLENRNG